MVLEKNLISSLDKLYSIPGKIYRGMVFQELVAIVMDLLFDQDLVGAEDIDLLLNRVEKYISKNDGMWLSCERIN